MSTDSRPLGVNIMNLETRRDAILHLAIRADELGYEALSFPETWSYDAMLILTEISVRTQQIRPWATILGVWGRSAAQIAMASATLNMISGGRFMLGLGTSTKQLAEGLHDVSKSVSKKLSHAFRLI
ncbi:MAG: LLM class flavin-dependent oxidoreductase [Ardenticatenaceae bacterium]|nr:LLM class flavin-dependent oxidoreductase [Ardenticatenaceae bacterium]